jgi:ribose transport system permease protein/L-arabinose transport system permease protein
MTAAETPVPTSRRGSSGFRRVIIAIGVDNLSLVFALALLVILIGNVAPLFGSQLAGGKFFWTWQNLMNSLAQSIVIVGLLAIGETVVIVAGALDISVGSIASVASVFAAIIVTQGVLGTYGAGSMQIAILAGMAAGAFCGIINGLIVTVLKVNPIIATLGTLAAFDGLAFLIAPEGKPVGVVTQPDFTWLGTGRFLQDLPIPALGAKWPGVPVVFVVLMIVTIVMHVVMRYTDFGRSIYAIGGNATAARLAGINLRRVRITMYIISGMIAGLAGVLLTARTTSGNPINGRSLELQAITAVFLGGAATAGGRGTIIGTFLAVLLVGVLSNGMNLLGVNAFYQRVALGLLLVGAVAVAQFRQGRAERTRTRIAASA